MFHTSSHVVGAISYRAGALWPYRLVTSILSSLLKDYSASFSIETHTAVESISIGTDLKVPFCVHTSRGDIMARHVVHATNGYSAALIPGLLGKLFPLRGQMTAQRPGKLFPKLGGAMSWSIMHKNSGFEYMTQRPGLEDGVDGKGAELMLGGALLQSGGRGLDEIGVSNDADMNFNVGTYLGGVLPMLFGAKCWGADAEAGRVKRMWTGIMGFTVDVMPYVGRLESSTTGRKVPKAKKSAGKGKQLKPEPGEWIAAGYNGEGMVNAWLCGVAVGLMVLGREGADLRAEPGIPGGQVAEWLPAEYLISRERLAKGSIYGLASMV
jgi:glycine/D-amino acid oxidase-like deaminating enzyme